MNFQVKSLISEVKELHDLERFTDYCNLTPDMLDRIEVFLNLLLQWNQRISLISSAPSQWVVRHVFDSLSVCSLVARGKRVLDIGSGNGFPGIILAIVQPNIKFICVDSLGKKVQFLQSVVHDLELENVTVRHDRVENIELYGHLDTIIARAVTTVSELVKMSKHLLSPGSQLICMKANNWEHEVEELDRYLDKYHMKESFSYKVTPLEVPFLNEKRVVVCLSVATPKLNCLHI